jgi:putative sterol carrier protein
MPETISSKEQLALLLADKSDEDITDQVGDGATKLLDAVFAAMAERFRPENAVDATPDDVVAWEILHRDETYTYQFVVENGALRIDEGAQAEPRVTLRFKLPDFLRFVTGAADGVDYFLEGRMELDGDMLYAQDMQEWFAR